MMKKTIFGLAVLCLVSCLLCACGKETPLLTADDYKLDTETGATSRGIKIGDGAEAFLDAYREYMIFSAISDASLEDSSDAAPESATENPQADYQFLPVDEIPFDSDLTVILPAFFVDGLAIDTVQFCEDNEIAQADLISYLTNEAYLADHRVIYRYLVFTWQGGVITDIRSESMDYNQDASYYEAN